MRRHDAGPAAVILLAMALLVGGCGHENDVGTRHDGPRTLVDVSSESSLPSTDDPRQALALVPADVEELTLTDFELMRERLGYPGLSSDDLMRDRFDFWERARTDGYSLTEGLLRDQASRLWLDYDFGQDDVAWEVRFSGPEGAGYVVRFRDDQNMAEVQEAVADEVDPLADAEVLADEHLLVAGIAEEGEPVLASEPGLVDLLEGDQEATYLSRECVRFEDALGPDAGTEEQDRVLADHDIAGLEPLSSFAIGFSGRKATLRLGPQRGDLEERAALAADWPVAGPVGFSDGFSEPTQVDDDAITLSVASPVVAGRLVLTGLLPPAVCNEAIPIPEPTGI